VRTWRVPVCVAILILVLAPLTPAQVPDLVQLPPPPLPTGPAGVKAPPAPMKPSARKAGEAQVYGAVTDQSGAVLPVAIITAIDASGGNHTVVSNDQGQYSINLAPGV